MNLWYENLRKAPWTPPNNVFGIVWSILYTLMTISILLLLKHKDNKYYNFSIIVFFSQLVLNLIWSPIFFNLRLPFIALINMILLLILTLLTFYYFSKINYLSAVLLLPYIIWLCIAFSLNLYIVIYN